MYYINKEHEKRFKKLTEICIKSHKYMACAYLLSMTDNLYEGSEKLLKRRKSKFTDLGVKKCSTDEYIALCVCKEFFNGETGVTLDDLADRALISPMMFRVIVNAVALYRYGYAFLNYPLNELEV